MAGFGDDAIAIITKGLRRSTGSFAERLVSAGYIGDILTAPAAVGRRTVRRLLLLLKRRHRRC